MGKRKNKPYQAAIIDIGSHAARMDIFEILPGGDYRQLESLNQPLNLGADVFRSGEVSPATTQRLIHLMGDFRKKLDEYQMTHYRAVATSALREAFNKELVLSRVKYESGIDIEILEAQEEARIDFLSVREHLRESYNFDRMTGILFIVGTGSLIVISFENGRLRFCEDLHLGTIRAYDEHGQLDVNTGRLLDILNAADLHQRISEHLKLTPSRKIPLIAVGASVRLLASLNHEQLTRTAVFSPAEMHQLITQARKLPPAELIAQLNISQPQALSLAPCACLLAYFLEQFPCRQVLCPPVTTRTALLENLIRSQGDADDDAFAGDILAAAECLGQKYAFDASHAGHVLANAMLLFDKLHTPYNLSQRNRICLQVAALLHDIGRFVDIRQHHKHSWYLLSHAQLPGLSPAEQRLVACVARYHRKAEPTGAHAEYVSLPPEDKVTVLKLAAILRIADALDRSGKGYAAQMLLSLRGNELRILLPASADLAGEQLNLAFKSQLFSKVFGLQLQLGESTEAI